MHAGKESCSPIHIWYCILPKEVIALRLFWQVLYERTHNQEVFFLLLWHDQDKIVFQYPCLSVPLELVSLGHGFLQVLKRRKLCYVSN